MGPIADHKLDHIFPPSQTQMTRDASGDGASPLSQRIERPECLLRDFWSNRSFFGELRTRSWPIYERTWLSLIPSSPLSLLPRLQTVHSHTAHLYPSECLSLDFWVFFLRPSHCSYSLRPRTIFHHARTRPFDESGGACPLKSARSG